MECYQIIFMSIYMAILIGVRHIITANHINVWQCLHLRFAGYKIVISVYAFHVK